MAHEHAHDQHSLPSTSAHATGHCLIGCVIGETAGLMLGTILGLGTALTIALAVVLAYVAGMTLAVRPVMRKEGLSVGQALRVVWLGEAISIGVMEIVMNGVDYAIGGIQSGSILAPLFWVGLLASIPPAFLAAWPVNYWLLARELKTHH
ncbi:MAG: DUF4396 domain-containing protein [Candidatus Competibacterales bacterium]|nr:DUF4396 domain-containing protein [Candidatus Competibacterales bacterium]